MSRVATAGRVPEPKAERVFLGKEPNRPASLQLRPAEPSIGDSIGGGHVVPEESYKSAWFDQWAGVSEASRAAGECEVVRLGI
jgi:hypothetical protein